MEDDRRTEPSIEQWEALHALADRVKAMAPWTWMGETELFGVQAPGGSGVDFVSVMGSLGEHPAVALYLGMEGLGKFWMMQSEHAEDLIGESLLLTPQLQLSFEDREVLTARDRNLIKQLGRRYRGKQQWPWFCSFRPGFLPWYLDAEEAALLQTALEQLLDVAPRVKEDHELLRQGTDKTYMVRRYESDSGAWQDSYQDIGAGYSRHLHIAVQDEVLASFTGLKQSPIDVEVGLYAAPLIVEMPGQRPYPAWTLMLVDAQSGFVYHVEALDPNPSMDDLLGGVPMRVITQMAAQGIRPRRLLVRSQLIEALLGAFAGIARWKVKRVADLPGVNAARASFEELLGNRGTLDGLE